MKNDMDGTDKFRLYVKDLYERAILTTEKKTLSELARVLGIPRPSTLQRWKEGKISAKNLTLLEEYMKAHTDSLPPLRESNPQRVVLEETAEYLTQPPPLGVFISGQIAAGKVSFRGEDAYFKTIESLWAKSRYWGLTHGPTIYLEIFGESMLPDYAPGEVIACRAPRMSRFSEIPSGAPCVFKEVDGDDFTFKILRHGRADEVLAEPLNPEFEFIIFKKDAVDIPYIVIGSLRLEKKRSVMPVLRRK